MEIFKQIDGFEGYEISNIGRVKTLDRILIRKSKLGLDFEYRMKGRFLKLKTDKDGYKNVTIFANKKEYTFKVHRLVAMAFLPNPENLPIVNHKNMKVDDNRVENLEWCTYSYNNSYQGAGRRRALKTALPIAAYKDGVLVGIYPTSYDAARVFNCTSENIRMNCRGKNKTAKGHVFKRIKL